MTTDPAAAEEAEPGVGPEPGGPRAGGRPETEPGQTSPEPAESGAAEGSAGGDSAPDGDASEPGDEAARSEADGQGEPGPGADAGTGGAGSGEGTPSESGGVDAEGDTTGVEGGDGPAERDAARREGAGDGITEDDAVGESAGGDASDGVADGAAAGQLSEAEAELAAQRELRERIERRKAEKAGPVPAGGGLSGKAADLLAAVRAVESGEKPPSSAFREPEPAPRRPAQEPARQPQPVASGASTPAPVASESVDAVRAVLVEGGAPEALAPQVAAALGEGADTQLREDPWQLLSVAGVRPEQADGFARALLGAECGPDDERRGRAVAVWLLEQAALAGHTALEAPALQAALAQRSVPDPDVAVQSALAEGDALVFQDALDEPGAPPAPQHSQAEDDGEGEEGEQERPVRVLIGLERYALAEESLADGLARVVNSLPKEDGSATAWESAATGPAAELIRAVAGHGLVLHTGGEASRAEPAALVAVARSLGLRVCAATHSPDGRGRFAALLADAERTRGASSGAAPSTTHGDSTDTHGGASETRDAAAGDRDEEPSGDAGTHEAVTTVAGLLAGAEGPGRDADGMLRTDLLIVLDAPQLDVESAAMLAESLPDGARLVLSGDPGVLWSAGPGRVFADLLAARVSPQIASRTPDPGPVGELVSGIGIGELNQVAAPGKEVVIVPVRDAGEAVHRTVQLVADSVPRAIGIPTGQTQVITPGHGGAAGTRTLNAALKERLNPGPGRFGGFDPGDRIAYSPAPGRTVTGHVVKADADGLHLECAGALVVVPKERVEQSVRHGWALTAHQAVGVRWPAAVVVLPGDAAQALTRPWVYTAFGRAEQHLSVVHGVEQALPHAVAEVAAKPRTTRLPALLKAQVPAAV